MDDKVLTTTSSTYIIRGHLYTYIITVNTQCFVLCQVIMVTLWDCHFVPCMERLFLSWTSKMEPIMESFLGKLSLSFIGGSVAEGRFYEVPPRLATRGQCKKEILFEKP